MAATERCRLFVLLTCTLVLFQATSARADEASGTTTGRVELRGNYYYERSTRVVAPSVAARLDTARGLSVEGTYLVDSITSASVAAGALVDSGFTEIRHDMTLTVAGERPVGEDHVALSATVRGSREPDYVSASGTLSLRFLLDERNTTVGFAVTALHDEVRQVFRVGSQIRPPQMGPGGTTVFDEDFDGLVSSLSFERVVNPRLVLGAGYDLAHLRGFLASPYRQVQVNGILAQESHPNLRLRHTLSARAVLALPRADAALHVGLRGYADSWDIRAITVDARYYQSIGEFLLLRMRYRYYVQTAASFDSGLALPTYTGAHRYYTADPKMQAFDAHEFGFAWIVDLGFLGERAGFLRDAELEFMADYRLNSNRFGDAVIAGAAVRAPF